MKTHVLYLSIYLSSIIKSLTVAVGSFGNSIAQGQLENAPGVSKWANHSSFIQGIATC